MDAVVKATQDAIAIATQTGRTPYIEGGPGEGKTSFTQALARKFNAYFHIEIGSISDPLDFKGQPYIDGGKLKYQPAFYYEEANAAPRALILFDELPNSPGPVQAGMLTVLQDRRVGAYRLGEPHVWFIAAGNPIELCPNGTPLFAPMANRLVHFKWPFNVEMPGATACWAAGPTRRCPCCRTARSTTTTRTVTSRTGATTARRRWRS
jgi:MoxR-like ATPase